MQEPINYKGLWKASGIESYELSGDLCFDQDNEISLYVIGTFTGKEEREAVRYKSIHGFTTDGKLITLLDCVVAYSTSHPGITIGNINAKYLIIGEHFNSITDIKVDTIACHYYYLDEWVNITGVTIHKENMGKPYTTTLTYTQPSPIALYESQEKDIFLWFSASAPAFSGRIKDNTISQRVFVNFNYKNKSNLETAIKDVEHFRNFFAFGLSKVIVPTEILGYIKKDGEKHQTKIAIIYKERYNPEFISEKIFESSTLFSYSHIQDKIKPTIENWINRYEALQPVYDRYFDCIYNPQLYPFNQFLNYSSAVETYHRRTSDETYFPEGDFTAIRETLFAVLPKTAVNETWFNSRFSFANELTLRQRLSQLYEKFSYVTSIIEPDKKTFISNIVDVRNYFTHYSSKGKAFAVSDKDIFKYISSLEILLQTCLLYELGFTEDEIVKAVKRPVKNWHKFKNLD